MTKPGWETRLIHSETEVRQDFRSLATPVHRGSTTLFDRAAAAREDWRVDRAGYTYGQFGTPTTQELAARIAELEGGRHTLLAPGGQAALSLVNLALTKTGDHVLIPDNIYHPHRELATELLARFGVEAEFYAPTIGAAIERQLRENTALVWCESPGSVTFEVQDVRAIAAAAHARGAVVALDNTWSAGVFFDAFAHGVDVSMQALTKYIGGHSDLLLGSVTVRDESIFQRLGDTLQLLGSVVSPDDCSLALRGMKTLAVRLRALEASTLRVARWLAERPEIEAVFHPALPSCPGHELWKRDFTGSTSVFSILFQPSYTREQLLAFIDSLELFEIGYSWGGVTSLVVPHFAPRRDTPSVRRGSLVRLNIGLEATEDLIVDLERALQTIA